MYCYCTRCTATLYRKCHDNGNHENYLWLNKYYYAQVNMMNTSKYLRNFEQKEVKNKPINNPVLVALSKLIKIEKLAEELKKSTVEIKKSQEK